MSKKIGRFEYVKRGLVGACAATMLAGMCAVPAFAEDSTFEDGTMSSSVSINTSALGQISVTVPTKAFVGVASTDGSIQIGNYTFTNNSTLGIKISNMKVTADASANLVKADAADPGDNAISVKAKISDTAVELADYTGVDGDVVTGAPTIAKGATGTVELSGNISNPTKSGINSNIKIADVVWTLDTV